ncbi:FAD:protein FMN transferase [Desulfuribacillus alkaliarsenatis]|uniref:FAD:protein FMN transferase n=1 Tax=Desulfuribacillus alkaliarsenatis TaxID=766136 RepID=A0A1E5G651_9FIRM|nr:FAD:protein FMN transferase [Desulfuribacillus alkaliarsenatis]OEF98651.1 thiamine biosynthesis protein ApbE [Desulfuribacillus alkaliarsenatis]
MKNVRNQLLLVLLSMVLLLSACNPSTVNQPDEEELQYERFRGSFFDTFDTVVHIVGFTETEEEFQKYMERIEERFIELHQYFDKYNTYEGVNNIKTINDNAGTEPVEVASEIIDLILLSKEWYKEGEKKLNIAMGSVLEIWSDYRKEGMHNPRNAELPPMELLLEAAEHMDINDVIVDAENSTVFLADEKLRLNVGAVAKGYAAELVAQEMKKLGFKSFIINAGGDVRAVGEPLDSINKYWAVGIQDPDKISILAAENILDTIYLNDLSIVTSGDYERYFIVDGQIYHHLINPDTLMPTHHYRGVTIVTEDAGVADYLSTVAFLLPFEESKQFIENYEGAEALWILADNSIEFTMGMGSMLKSQGATID